MSNTAIVTDSCASIPADLIQKLNIHIVSYYIHRGEEILRDMVDIHPEEFYQWLGTAEILPKTATPGPGDYLRKFEDVINKGFQEIISIHMTSRGSGAFQAATIAARLIREKYPGIKLEVIDTLNVSLCHGWMVIEAARAVLRGEIFEKVIDRIRSIIPRAQMLQTADTLRYLYMGGRIGKAKHLVGKLLNIKPLISMENGVIVSPGQARTLKRVYEKMVQIIQNRVGKNGKIKVAYVHAAARDEAERLRAFIEERVTVVESIIAELSPALGVHSGPGTVGLCYFQVVD